MPAKTPSKKTPKKTPKAATLKKATPKQASAKKVKKLTAKKSSTKTPAKTKTPTRKATPHPKISKKKTPVKRKAPSSPKSSTKKVSTPSKTPKSSTKSPKSSTKKSATKSSTKKTPSKKQKISKSVLILGAGMVVKPIVHYLSNKGFIVYLGSRGMDKAAAICKGAKNAQAMQLDIETKEGKATLDEYAQKVDAIISLLPYVFHPEAAQYALKHKKHFLTSSYVSEAMKKLGPEAKKKGLVFINECGVDPGTDHMSAMRVIDEVRSRKGWITSFYSLCGGLPHPDSNNNPLGYKFSWAPRGVLLASKNTATFTKDGKIATIPGADLFDHYELVEVPGHGTFEAYPNRDSNPYIDIYGVKKVKTILRGTFRNVGWCGQIKKLVDLGFLDLTDRDLSKTSYLQLLAEMTKSIGKDAKSVKAHVAKKLKVKADDKVLASMEWLGLFSDELVGAPRSCLDALCKAMQSRMQYAKGERDMIMMQHTFEAEFPNGKKEFHRSVMCSHGIKGGDSAMARTVTIPLAIAARMVLNGEFSTPGLSIPTIPELYNPILMELEEHGIKWVETCEPFPKK